MAVFPQTESLQNISNLSRILKIEGVTGTIVGPFDLALDIGGIDPKALLSEVVDTPAVNARLQQIVDICRETGKVAGIGGCTPKRLAYWAKQGYQLLLVGYVLDGNVEKLRPAIEESRALIG
jgi:2-keto-3-deoxy-L-rhamnonate aldolase RhmA